jgi:outer membrane receptor protein involved in Fe transport
LTWEKTTTYNIGVDFDLLDTGLISGGIDVYKRYTSDLLSLVSAPPGQALKNQIIDNVGKLETKGVELNLNLKPISKEDYSLSFNGNISYNIGEITDLNLVYQWVQVVN